jgi:hypothetical protein
MSSLLLRRIAIWIVLVVLSGVIALRVGLDVAASVGTYRLASDVELGLTDLAQRQAATVSRRDALRAERRAEGFVVPSIDTAAEAFQAAIQAALSVGDTLSLNINATAEETVMARLLWRGTEEDMHRVLETLARDLPHIRWVDFNMRAVSIGGSSQVELSGSFTQVLVVSS